MKLNYYIKNMPTEGLPELPKHQKQRIKEMVEHLREYPSIEEHFPEVQEEYWRSINSIIIKKHLRESKHDLVPCDLIVSFNKKPVVVP
jgi:hypothetical protein